MSEPIRYEPPACTEIMAAIHKAVTMAEDTGNTVLLVFNDIEIPVTADSVRNDIAEQYFAVLNARNHAAKLASNTDAEKLKRLREAARKYMDVTEGCGEQLAEEICDCEWANNIASARAALEKELER